MVRLSPTFDAQLERWQHNCLRGIGGHHTKRVIRFELDQ